MNRKTRIFTGVLLAMIFTVCFFALGAFLAANLGLADGQGLAGGAIVFGYGLGAAIIGIILSIALSIYLPARWLVSICFVFGIVASILFWKIFAAMNASRVQSEAHLQQAYDNFPKFRVLITQSGSSQYLPFERMEMDWADRSYQLSANGKHCSVGMSGEQALQMLTALRSVENTVLSDGFSCANDPSGETLQFEMFIQEALPPNTEATLSISPSCIQDYPGLEAPLLAARDIYRSSTIPDGCL